MMFLHYISEILILISAISIAYATVTTVLQLLQ